MKNFKNDWKYLLAVDIIFLAVIGFLVFMIQKQTSILVDKKHKLMALEKKDQSLAKLQKDFQTSVEDIEIINKALPDKKKIVDFIDDLEKEASRSGLKAEIKFASQAVVSEKKGIKSVNFDLKFKGTYNQMLEFIEKIEKKPQIVAVEKLNVLSGTGIQGENTVILTARCYVDPEF